MAIALNHDFEFFSFPENWIQFSIFPLKIEAIRFILCLRSLKQTKKKENPPRRGLTSLKGLGMAESISTLMKESSPSADRLELSAEGACEMTRFTSFFLLLSDSSFFFCRTEAPSAGGEGGRIILQIIISNVHLYPLACFNLITGVWGHLLRVSSWPVRLSSARGKDLEEAPGARLLWNLVRTRSPKGDG